MGLSIRAYARHRGVSHVAVKKAIDTGRITRLPDGTIDPDEADRQWARNTLNGSAAATSRRAARPTARATARDVPEDPGTQTPPLPTGFGAGLGAGGTTLLQARTVNEVLKAKLKQVELAERKEELVDRAKAVAHVFKLARAERDAWLNWPARISAQLAAKLGVEAHRLHVLLEAAVREHLAELGEIRPKVD